MAGERSISLDLNKYKEGLIYDADAITLLGKYSDELAAHRAKRRWIEVLNSHFLLERERDYELWVTSIVEDKYFVLSCYFTSACGRYTFWRLINHQAPEAEEKLGGNQSSAARKLLESLQPQTNERKNSWVFSAITDTVDNNEETAGLLNRLMRLFQ